MPANFGGTAFTNDILQWARMLMIHSLDPFPTAKVFNCSDGVRITGTIPKLPRTVSLSTPVGRRDRVIAQVKDALAYITAPDLAGRVSLETLMADFADWEACVDDLVQEALATEMSFPSFYARMLPELRESGRREFQNVLRAAYIGSLMMIFQVGYFFYHRIPDHEQVAMMRAFLAIFIHTIKDMHDHTYRALAAVKAQLDARRADR